MVLGVSEGSSELAQTSPGPMRAIFLPVCERLCVLGFCLMFPKREFKQVKMVVLWPHPLTLHSILVE